MDALDLSPMELNMMVAAYVRRQEWLAERTAVNIVNLLGKAMQGGKGNDNGRSSGRTKPPPQQVSASQMLAMAGKEII